MLEKHYSLSWEPGSASAGLIAALGLLLTVVGVIVAILAWQLPKAPRTSKSDTASLSSAAIPSATFKEGTDQLPQGLIGSWAGEMTQLREQGQSVSYPVTLTLRRPEAGTIVGESNYPRVHCIGRIRIDRVRQDSVVLHENMITPSCGGPYSFTVKPLDSKRIYVSYQLEGGSKKGEGVLSRS
jgi:hypothetical protein